MTTNARLYNGIPNQHTTQAFGHDGHRGRDSRAKAGTDGYAAGFGTVVATTTRDPIYGCSVTTSYRMDNGDVVKVLDGHLNSVLLPVGTEITPATHLFETGGIKGSPGAGVSKAQHLHESVWVNNKLVDPNTVLHGRETIPAGGTGTQLLKGDTMLIRFGDKDSITDFAYEGGVLKLVTDVSLFNNLGAGVVVVIPDTYTVDGNGRNRVLEQLFGMPATEIPKFTANPNHVWVHPALRPVGGTYDIAALVAAIDKADDDEHAELLAAIKANPEAIRALLTKALATV